MGAQDDGQRRGAGWRPSLCRRRGPQGLRHLGRRGGNHSDPRVVIELMPHRGWRSRRVAAAVAIAAALVGVSVLFIVLGIRNQQAADAAILPPIMPTADAPYASAEPQFHIPAAVT